MLEDRSDRSGHQHDAEQRAPRNDARRRRRPASTSSSTSRSPNTIADARALTEACRDAGVVLALGYQRRKESHFRWIRKQIDDGVFGKLVNAEANISRDRLGKIDLTSWRYTAEGMPGGVMLQIGIHYSDVLEYLHRPGQSGERPPRAARAAGRQPRCREPDPRARERRALDAQRELRVGFRVLRR